MRGGLLVEVVAEIVSWHLCLLSLQLWEAERAVKAHTGQHPAVGMGLLHHPHSALREGHT